MNAKSDLKQLLEFITFTHLAHHIERVARIKGMERYANIVEHSFQLALVAWYIIEKEHLPFNKDLALKYALVHDLIEVYAGDTYFLDTEAIKTKQKREDDARRKIQREFPEFKELHDLLEAYERRDDAESKFVYALDKFMDPVNIYLEGGQLWKEKGISLEMMIRNKTEKILLDPTMTKYFDALICAIKKREPELFH